MWWIVLVGAALGVLPQRRVGLPGLVGVGLLACLAAWSGLSATWSESTERAISETARIVTLLGVLVLAASALRAEHVRPLVHGVFAAIVSVAVVACLSRLHPAWFGPPETVQFLEGTRARLSYGLNYWNALAAFIAMGLPLGLSISMSARTVSARAAALATLPVLVLTWFFTVSRGGMLASAVGLLIVLSLTPERGRCLAKLSLAAAGAAILVKGALQRDVLRDGLAGPLARDQGDELLVIALIVAAGIVLVHVGLSLARAGGLLPVVPRMRVVRPRRAWAGALLAAAFGIALLATSGVVRDAWEDFKNPQLGVQGAEVNRLGSVSGEGRYHFWTSAVDAFESAPIAGIGAGGFQNWWARNATYDEFVRNAHSLYAETLAELGLVGILLLGGLMLLFIGAGIRSVRRATGPPRALLAGAIAACAAFALAGALDWIWQVTVLPACFLLLAAAVLASPGSGRMPHSASRPALVLMSVVALVALAVPLAGVTKLRASQRDAAAQRLAPALAEADSARRLQPYAESPLLQRALILELRGDLAGAAAAARAAERNEPTSWRAPLVLARLETRRGRTAAGVAAFRRARSLNKTSSLLR